MDESKSLLFDLAVNLSDIKTLNQQLGELKRQMDALVQLKEKNKVTDFQFEQKNIQYQEREAALVRQIAELKSKSLVEQNKQADKSTEMSRKAHEQEKRQIQEISSLRAKQNAEANRQYWIDEENARKRRTLLLQQQMMAAPKEYAGDSVAERKQLSVSNRIRQANGQSYYESVFNSSNYDKYYSKNYDAIKKGLDSIGLSAEATSKSYFSLGNSVDYFFAKFRSHAAWIATGGLIGAVLYTPAYMVEVLTKIEKGMAGFNQVMDHTRYTQADLNKEASKFLDIAAVYGEKVEEITQAGQLWGRMYKDLAIVNALVGQSAVVAVADNMSLVDANKSLEAAMFQYGLVAKNSTEALAYSGKIIDIWTKLAHNGGVSAKDLADAVERSGSVARITGVDFEFLNAMIATGVRSTGRSGAEIGNMIKSVLGSFHSDKAIAEIEALGVSVTKVGKDGQTEFRKAQDVLLDISLEAQGTEKNLEELFKQVAGGKFQWSKSAAMLGDYQEFIRTWGEAVNSTGFAATQVEMQLDTISRKTQKLSQDLQKLVAGTGNAGLTQWLKEQIAALDNFVVGLQGLSTGTWKAIGYLTLAAPVIYTVVSAVKTLNTTLIETGSIMTALAKRNVIVAGLMVVGYAIFSLVESYGALANASRDAAQKAQDSVAVKEQELNMYKEQGEFIETLIGAHKRLSDQLDSGTLSTEKADLAKNNLKATEEELTKVIGAQGVENLRVAGWSEEAAEIEKKAHSKKYDAIKDEIRLLKEQQLIYTDQQIQNTQDRIDALATETKAWGLYAKAIAFAMEQYAGILDKQIAFEEWVSKSVPTSPAGEKARAESLAFLKSRREYVSANAYKPVQDEMAALNNELTGLKVKRGQQILSSVNFEPTRPGGSEAPEDGGGKGKNKVSPMDNTSITEDKKQYLAFKQREQEINLKLKQSNDELAISIDNINAEENLYGQTTDTMLTKRKATEAQIVNLNNILGERKQLSNDILWQLNQEIAKDAELNAQMSDNGKSYENMTAKEQKLQRQRNQELLQSSQVVAKLYTIFTTVEGSVSETTKEVNKLANELKKVDTPGWFGNKQVLQRQLDSSKRNEDAATNAVTDNYDPFNSRKLWSVKYSYAVEQQKIMYNQMLDAQKEYSNAAEALKNTTSEKTKQQLRELVEKNKIALNEVTAAYDKQTKDIINLEKSKNEEIRSGFAGITQDIIVQGSTLKNVWNNLWSGLANDAIKALFRVQNSTPGLLSNLLGLFKGSSGASVVSSGGGYSSGWMSSFSSSHTFMHNGGAVTKNPQMMHEGGMVKPDVKEDEVIRKLKVGERVLTVDSNKAFESYLSKNNEYAPYLKNPGLNTSSSVNVQVQQSERHIQELERQNKLMVTQNQMIFEMLNSSGGKNNGSVAQPIVLQQKMSEDELENMIYKMRSRGRDV